MILRRPTYYKKFKCIADKCSDNCCIGWAIDIDPVTAEKYNSLQGDFGERLRNNIADGSFVLKGERCPFLNSCNLCDIITTLGEEHICSICTEHPRYYGWYGSIKEGGIGLCCEEAARIILTEDLQLYDEDIPDEETEEVDDEAYSLLDLARQRIFQIAAERERPLALRLADLLFFAEQLQDNLDFGDLSLPPEEEADFEEATADADKFASAFADLEPIDKSWSSLFDTDHHWTLKANEELLTGIFNYYIWRYFMKAVFDFDVLSRVRLAAACCIMTALLAEGTTLQDYITAAKLLSKEVEYSEENLDAVLEMTYTDPAFSSEHLIALLS